MAAMKLSYRGRDFIRSHEKLHKLRDDGLVEAYPDPKTGGAPWTIGWGCTGPHITKGTVWTVQQCVDEFDRRLDGFERDVNSLVKAPVTQGQFDALVSFAFNCGSDIDADTKAEGLGDSTLLRKLNAADYEGAAGEFCKWISRGSPAEHGLRNRRAAEVALYWS